MTYLKQVIRCQVSVVFHQVLVAARMLLARPVRALGQQLFLRHFSDQDLSRLLAGPVLQKAGDEEVELRSQLRRVPAAAVPGHGEGKAGGAGGPRLSPPAPRAAPRLRHSPRGQRGGGRRKQQLAAARNAAATASRRQRDPSARRKSPFLLRSAPPASAPPPAAQRPSPRVPGRSRRRPGGEGAPGREGGRPAAPAPPRRHRGERVDWRAGRLARGEDVGAAEAGRAG